MLLADAALARTLDAYRTCEFATLTADGTPVAWPTSALRGPDGTLLVTTSVAFPQKAVNVRRDARVALLFSDATGSGLAGASQVLIRGTATCPDEIHTAPDGELGRLWALLFRRQPSSRAYLGVPARWFADWYFMRLLITVVPTEVTDEPLPVPAAPAAGGPLVGADVLAGYGTVVLAARDGAGAPVLRRTTVEAATEGYRLALRADSGFVAGPASLLVHRHDEKLSALHNAVVRGSLTRAGDSWVLAPDRLIEPAGGKGAADTFGLLRRCRATTRRYLRRRGLERPRIPWAAYRELARSR